MKAKKIILQKAIPLSCFWVLLFFANSLTAQIIYTDIPDVTPNATYSLDLNNDSMIDFLIQFDLIDKVVCKPQNNNAYLGNVIDGVHLPLALAASNNICDSLTNWYDASNPGTMAWGTSMGYWVGETNKYLALQLIVGSNTYYGWVRLDFVPTSTSFTVKDYAYNRTPNACIQPGKIMLGNNENSDKRTFTISPNPCISKTTIQINSNLKNATLTICNAYGQTVKQINNITGQTFLLYRDNLPSGLYLIRLVDESKIIAVDKLIITD